MECRHPVIQASLDEVGWSQHLAVTTVHRSLVATEFECQANCV